MNNKQVKGAKSFLKRTMDENKAKFFAEFIGAIYAMPFGRRLVFGLKLIFRIRR
jgi:hypothetical protein